MWFIMRLKVLHWRLRQCTRSWVSGSALVLLILLLNACSGTEDGNIPPRVDAGTPISLAKPELMAGQIPSTITFTIFGSASDRDGRVVSYQWSQVSGPSITLVNPQSSVLYARFPYSEDSFEIVLRLTVVDDGGASASDEVTISYGTPVTTVPSAPTVPVTKSDTCASSTDATALQVDAGPDQVVSIGDRVDMIASPSNNTGPIVNAGWRRVEGIPLGSSLNGASTLHAWFLAPKVAVSANSEERIYQIEIEDQAHNTAVDCVKITVIKPDGSPGNNPPVVNAGADRTVTANTTVTLEGIVSDSDGSIATLAWQQQDGPTVMLANLDTLTPNFTAPADVSSATALTFRLTATDNLGARSSDTVVITVMPIGAANIPPTVNAGPDQAVNANTTVNLTGIVNDSDGSIATVLWQRLSGPAITLADTGLESTSFIAPNVSTTTILTLRLTATDNLGASSSDTVVITIVPPAANLPPIANAGVDQSVESLTTVTLSGSGVDGDGSIATYLWQWLTGPVVTITNANSATASFVAPTVTASTNITFRLTVTDNQGASSSDTVVITIVPANIPPSVNAGIDQTVESLTTVTLGGSGVDTDGSIASYLWTRLTGPVVTITNANSATASFVAPSVTASTSLSFRLTVTDNQGASSSDTVVITVNPAPNLPPTANAGVDQTVESLTTVTLSGSGVDSDGSIATYLWQRLTGPVVTLTNANSATASFVAPSVAAPTSLSFRLTVTDDQGDSGTDDIVITVTPPFSATLSGVVTSMGGHTTDSDINSTSASYASNDSFDRAQVIDTPGIIGGYVNQPGQGAIGRSKVSGDVNDYFVIPLQANQVLTLVSGDPGGTANDLDLYLYDQFGALVDASLGAANTPEVLTVVNDGSYFVRVTAVSGASNYVLAIDSAASIAASGSLSNASGWSTQSEFVTGEAIVKFMQPLTGTALDSGTGINTAANVSSRVRGLGLSRKAGASDRSMLVQLPAVVPSTGLSAASVDTVITATVDAELQTKLDTLLAIKSLAQQSDVEYTSPNYIFRTNAVPNDPNYGIQWHYPLINLPAAWDLTTGDASVVVAVIDNGILPGHPDLAGKLIDGYDFVSNDATSLDGQPGIDADPTDPGDGRGIIRSGFHGTHVAGTIAAATNNSRGVAGVGWNVKVMPLRALGIDTTRLGNSVGTLYDIEQALLYAAGLSNDSGRFPSQPAAVVNMSLGNPSNNITTPQAFVQARAAGVILIAAAGNDASSQTSVPAAYNGVVSVSAVTSAGVLASYSNFGSTIDVTAPGGGNGDVIVSTTADDSVSPMVYNYGGKAGTSMAAPHVAGVAALMKSVYPALTPNEFDAMLSSGQLTDDIGNAGRDNNYGYGLINAQKAVQAAIIANGGALPVLLASPSSLDFGIVTNTTVLTLSSTGSVSVSNITQNSSGWLTVNPASVDASGIGSYNVSVNRSFMSAGSYSATITISSNASAVTVPVIMRVVAAALPGNAGFQLIDLINASDSTLVDRFGVNPINGKYSFSFPDVPIGVYRIHAGSDSDNDGVRCEVGDACGAYPDIGSSVGEINVDGSNSTINGLDFETGYHLTPVSP